MGHLWIYFISHFKLATASSMVNLKTWPLPGIKEAQELYKQLSDKKHRVTFLISLRRKSYVMAGETSG